jgi:hypothetical protein
MAMVAAKVREEAAPGGEHPRERPSVEASRVQPRYETTDVRGLHLPQWEPPCLVEKRLDVAPIAAHSVGAQPALVGKVLEIAP